MLIGRWALPAYFHQVLGAVGKVQLGSPLQIADGRVVQRQVGLGQREGGEGEVIQHPVRHDTEAGTQVQCFPDGGRQQVIGEGKTKGKEAAVQGILNGPGAQTLAPEGTAFDRLPELLDVVGQFSILPDLQGL